MGHILEKQHRAQLTGGRKYSGQVLFIILWPKRVAQSVTDAEHCHANRLTGTQ